MSLNWKQWIRLGFTSRQAKELSRLDAGGASAPSSSGGVVTANLPAGLEFAFWGYSTAQPGARFLAFRVLEAGDYSWADEGDVTLTEGFDWDHTQGDADLEAMEVGQYVIFGLPENLTPAQYALYTGPTRYNFDPQRALPGAFHPHLAPPAIVVGYNHFASGLAATDVQTAIDELTARIIALETP